MVWLLFLFVIFSFVKIYYLIRYLLRVIFFYILILNWRNLFSWNFIKLYKTMIEAITYSLWLDLNTFFTFWTEHVPLEYDIDFKLCITSSIIISFLTPVIYKKFSLSPLVIIFCANLYQNYFKLRINWLVSCVNLKLACYFLSGS